MTEHLQLSYVGYVAQSMGVSEPAFRLFLGVLAGYPLALIHRKYTYKQDEKNQCIYFALSGLSIGLWNYGFGMFHCLFSILITYFAILFLKGLALVTFVFIFNFGYLLIGYVYSSTDSYDITWTMPYCILVLRLIGVAYDVYDGTRPKEQLSSDALKTALSTPPTLLQLFSHSLFPSGFLVGPQFSMRRFLDFVGGKFNAKGANGEILPPDSVKASLTRFSLGVFYMAVFQVLGLFLHDDYIISDEFAQMNLLKRLLLLGVWGRFILYRYISVWLFAEGACILFGLSYNGEENNEAKWDGVANIKLSVFENSTEFNHYIMSFNVNTNQWVAQHIYKRLKFLGNKYYSQAGVLLFLALWHGLHSGYYVTFLHEFIVIYVERDAQYLISKNETLSQFFANPIVKFALQMVLRLYAGIFMGWSLLPFVYLQFPRYWKACVNCSFAGFVVFYMWPVCYGPLLRILLRKKKEAQS